jgi:hypothetical protein
MRPSDGSDLSGTSKAKALDPVDLMWKMMVVIIIPLVVGKLVREFSSRVREFVAKYKSELKVTSSLFLISVPWMSMSAAADDIGRARFSDILLLIILGTILHIVLLLFNFYACDLLAAIPGFSIGLKEKKAVVISASQKTLNTAVSVIAFLPAKKKSKKTIVYTAHYDHLGRMGTNTYFPGANDNASGTAMLLSMAAYFKKNPVDYNVLFIAFAGEEAGLVGSKHFVENPTFKLKKMSFLLNLDIMGSGEEGVTVVNATLYEKQFALLQEINKEKQLLAQVKSRGPAANSDHYWFIQFNVPAFFIYTMGPNKHYHDIFDTYEELSFVEYQDITTMLVEFGKRFTK